MPDLIATTSTKFQPGAAWRGNAAGRPRVGESVAELIRSLCGQDAKPLVEQLLGLATGGHRDVKARIEAIKLLLAYGFGKPLESLNISGGVTTIDPAKLARLSDAELEQAAAIVAKLAAEG